MKYTTKKKITLATGLTCVGLGLVSTTSAFFIARSEGYKNLNLLEKYGYNEFNQEYILNEEEKLYNQYEQGLLDVHQLSDGIKAIENYDKEKFINENATKEELEKRNKYSTALVATVAGGYGLMYSGMILSIDPKLFVSEKNSKKKNNKLHSINCIDESVEK